MSYYVYIHTCKANNKKYVGVTTQTKPEYRWREGNGYQTNKHFYSAILKHGWDNFEHEVFEVESEEEMYRKEVELISFYHSNDPRYGYNNSSGGEHSFLGCRHSEESRKRIAEARKGKPLSEETRKHIAESKKGKPRSEETRKKIAESHRGKTFSEEAKRHISEAKKGKSRKPFSEETKRRMSEACKNRPKVKISLPDGTIIEISKQNLVKNYVNKGRKFEYVS